jgi:pimeloyl-ACP methyl ester carboxylesterase
MKEGAGRYVKLSEDCYVTADDGVRLYLRVKGSGAAGIPILYLHGGPGGGLNLAAFETCAGPLLESVFHVAYLHQRGVLRSRQPGTIRQRLSLHVRDIRAVVTFLCRRFQHPTVHIVAHSWGAFAGGAYLCRHASSVAKFVAVCPVFSIRHIQEALYTLVADRVVTGRDALAGRELAALGAPPYPDLDDFIRLQGLASEDLGDPYRYIVPRDLEAHTGYSLDVDDCLAVQTQIAARLWPDLYRQDLTAALETLTTPVFMVACDRDGAVPWTSVEKAFRAYARRRPEVEKRWLLVNGSNHLPFTEPSAREQILKPIIDFLVSDPVDDLADGSLPIP